MGALVLLFACLALGIVVAHVARPPAGLAQSLNWWVINIALPALVLNVIPRIHFETQFWFLTAANWLVFIGSWLLFAALGKALGWSRARIGALTLVGGLGNTAFMGYPMILALRGTQGLSLAVIGDQTGCFTALVIGGVAVTVIYADRPLRPVGVNHGDRNTADHQCSKAAGLIADHGQRQPLCAAQGQDHRIAHERRVAEPTDQCQSAN